MKLSFSGVVALCLWGCLSVVNAQHQILPKPVSVEIIEGAPCLLTKDSAIILQSDKPEFKRKAEFIQKCLAQRLGGEWSIYIEKEMPKGLKFEECIFIREDKGLAEKGAEAYTLSGGKEGIILRACDAKGLFYAFQSLLQMMPVEIFGNKGGATEWKVSDSAFSIEDYPRFPWRAMLIDEARYFFGMETIKQMIDQMALMKMNVLHWHLTDDAGWRIEIKKYPKLIELGSKRKDTEIGTWHSGKYSGQPHSGFYTQDQIKEVVQYAADRNITIVPEVDMPGHCTAASVAYPELSLKPLPEIQAKFAINTACNPTREFTYQFMSDVLDEVAALFPSEIIHTGGDEVRYNDQWKGEPEIEAFMKEHNMKSFAEVQMYFTNRMSQILAKKGKRMMGWNEIFGHDVNNEGGGRAEMKLDTKAQIHFWKGDANLAKEAIKAGHDVVNSWHSYTYLDYSEATIPLEKSYNFEPIFEGLESEYHAKVKGLGCQLWSEWIPNSKRLHEQAFPRACAYAETGWTPKEMKNYGDFRKRLLTHGKRMEAMGIQYSKQYLEKVYADDFADDQQVGHWTPESVKSGELSIDVTSQITQPGKYTVYFLYEKGADGLDIEAVTLEEEGKGIATDTHEGFSGASQKDIAYKWSVPQIKDGAKYILKAKVKGKGGTNSHGVVCLVPASDA